MNQEPLIYLLYDIIKFEFDTIIYRQKLNLILLVMSRLNKIVPFYPKTYLFRSISFRLSTFLSFENPFLFSYTFQKG